MTKPTELKNEAETVKEVMDARREHVEGRREAKIERAEGLAEKHQAQSEARFNQAHEMASVIPFGQPILVGHHSEKRDRRYRAKIHNNMGKGVEHQETAEYYRDKANRLESSTVISPDDPDALKKLKQKLKETEENHAMMKQVNKCLRLKAFRALTDFDERVSFLVENSPVSQALATTLLTPDRGNRLGFQSYQLSYATRDIRDLKKRIEKKMQEIQDIAQNGAESEERHDDIQLTITRDRVENRIKFKFDARLSREGYKFMKSNGFKVTRQGVFQRYNNTYNDASKEYLLKRLKRLEGLF